MLEINYEYEAIQMMYYALVDDKIGERIPSKSELNKDCDQIRKFIKKLSPKVKKEVQKKEDIEILFKKLCGIYKRNIFVDLFVILDKEQNKQNQSLNNKNKNIKSINNIDITNKVTKDEIDNDYIKIYIFRKLYRENSELVNNEDILDFSKYYNLLEENLEFEVDDKATALYYISKFHNNFNGYFNDFKEIVNNITELIKVNIDENIKELMDKYGEKIDDRWIKKFNMDFLGIDIEFKNPKLSIVAPLNLNMVNSVQNDTHVVVGIFINEGLDLLIDKSYSSRVVNIFKALGDETRFEMFLLSNEKEIYIQEMANKFNVKPSTISHHLNILLEENLLKVKINIEDKQKILYRSNIEEIKRLRDYLNELIGE